MHITIINASPNNSKTSQTAQIIQAFERGILKKKSTTNVYWVGDSLQRNNAIHTITCNENFVIVLPVYLGLTPSLAKEFLEQVDTILTDKQRKSIKIAFILQSAFPEASQRRCCEKYLESFVTHLKCQFSGILSHSIYYGLADSINSKNLMDEYCLFGRKYIENNATFFFDEVKAFNGAEHLTEQQAKRFVRGFNFMSKLNAEEQGISGDLYSNPYNQNSDIK